VTGVTAPRTELNVSEDSLAVPQALAEGATVWFTGLPSSGKSTLAQTLHDRLAARSVPVQLFDGDAMRATLCRDLGFSREDRMENVRRIGHKAATLVADGIVVLCPVIAPYREAREQVRSLHHGRFFEVYVATPVEVCRQRDVKGLYAKQAAGLLHGLTGIDDPYEAPDNPELVLFTDDAVVASVDTLWQALTDWRPRSTAS
jgi:adenylylsulfate kinase